MKITLGLSSLGLAILLAMAGCGKKMALPSESPLSKWGAGDTTYVRINPPWDRNHPYGHNFQDPRDVIVGRDGHIWVADSLFIWKLDRAGQILDRYLIPGVVDIRAIDQGPDFQIYAVRGDSIVYLLNGDFFLTHRKARYTGVAVDDENWIYLADSGRQMLLKFSADDPSQSDTLATYGTGGGTVDLPRGITTDISLNVYFVQEGGSFHVQKMRPSATGYLPDVYFGLQGDSLKQFMAPQDVAVDADGYIYVADTGNHRIQKFSPYGGLKIAFGDSGSAGEQFIFPEGIAVDENLILYIADTGNDRVERYQLSTEIDIPEEP
jgi:DNA-binding beta-propeller fold protein YncE